jgi:hypothetical protein
MRFGYVSPFRPPPRALAAPRPPPPPRTSANITAPERAIKGGYKKQLRNLRRIYDYENVCRIEQKKHAKEELQTISAAPQDELSATKILPAHVRTALPPKPLSEIKIIDTSIARRKNLEEFREQQRRMRLHQLISIYHQASNFVTMDNVDSAVDKAVTNVLPAGFNSYPIRDLIVGWRENLQRGEGLVMADSTSGETVAIGKKSADEWRRVFNGSSIGNALGVDAVLAWEDKNKVKPQS